jgi:DNA-binding beta-propeller fold protein YncE
MKTDCRPAHGSRILNSKLPALLLLLLLLFVSGCAVQAPVRNGASGVDAPSRLSLRVAGTLDPPSGSSRFDPGILAVDSRGRVFVADRSRGTIFVYDGPGPPVATLADPPSEGASGPRFQDVRGIEATSGLSVFVLDGGAGRVYGYDVTNQLRGTVLALDSPPVEAAFGRVRGAGLLLDRTGQPIVVDREGDRLLVFNPQWEPSHAIGGPGMTAGGFRDPVGIATDDRGRLFVADRGNRLVQVFSAAGAFLEDKALEHPPESIAVTPGGDILVGDSAGFIVIFPASGGRTLVPPPASGSGPVSLALSPDGSRLYAARSVRGVVEVMDLQSRGASP